MTPRRLATAALAVTFAAALLGACTSATHGRSAAPAASTTASPPSTSAPSTSRPAATAQYYVSIGDSYAAGYQPTGAGTGGTTRNGFAYQLVPLAAARGYHLKLVNFGCSGATTASVLKTAGCPAKDLGPGAAPYTATQAVAAEDFIRAHRAAIGLVTISLGGNDVTACGLSASPLTCLSDALTRVKTNLATLLTGLRSAGGTATRIVGITYPDVLLAGSLTAIPAAKTIATLSVTAFQSLINPALKATYAAAGAGFVDVTAATGAYGPLTATTTLAPYGTIPVPVAKVCTLTYSCQYHDIHPRTAGYAIIAGLIAAELPKR
ncbi:SGNH/GDSL hydrolase family protein [Jatrophihabitans sp.]|uniref:SGNH/GDSL hydrolase family protein n=1 Tax=Jatrophihabitans sp. TaxID=1932789 RepID=UPI0030C70CFE|nr:hypothetical protein [Jatrophihabitans sp.]